MATITTTPGGDALRAVREELGLTQVQLGDAAHLNQGYISLIERGRRPLTPEVATRIIRRCGVDPMKLLPYTYLGGYLAAAA